MRVCVIEQGRAFVPEGERERVCVCVLANTCVRAHARVCVCACMRTYVREKEYVCEILRACVCVWFSEQGRA